MRFIGKIKDIDKMHFDFDKMSKEFGIKLPKVKLVKSPDKEELLINGKSVCCHKHLYPVDVLNVLDTCGIIEFENEDA